MLEKLKNVFATDAFAPGSSVFPTIDSNTIANSLRLEEQGRKRGKQNQPPADTLTRDNVEMKIIERVEELRRKGLQNFEEHLRVYRERLNRASEARKEVEIAAGKATSDFRAEVRNWTSRLTTPKERVSRAHKYRDTFREIHGIPDREAKHFGGWMKTIAILMLLLVIEVILNGYLFAQRNELGMLGGIMAATLVSIANVGVSFVSGLGSRWVIHRNLAAKIFGLAVFLFWLAYALGFNVGVAHFRDAVEMIGDWREATRAGLENLTSNPFGIESVESWLLIVVGCLISLFAFLKGLTTLDIYPGYGTVERNVTQARDDYAEELDEAIADLTQKRDDAIEELREADTLVRRGINESVDALFGQSTLGSHLNAFLEQCDVKVQTLLAIYHDANLAARTEPAPKTFNEEFRFEPFQKTDTEGPRRQDAEKEREAITKAVEETIKKIFDEVDHSIDEYRSIEDIQGNYEPRPRRVQPAKDTEEKTTSEIQAGDADVVALRKEGE